MPSDSPSTTTTRSTPPPPLESSRLVLDRSGREKCWSARDNLFNCFEKYSKDNEGEQSMCNDFRVLLFEACPGSWAEHFLGKRRNDRLRAAEMKKLGARELEEAIKNGEVTVRLHS